MRGDSGRKIITSGISSLSECRSQSEKRRVPGIRPRRATCGRDETRTSCTSEIAAPIMTPRSRPKVSTPPNAAIATTNSGRSLRHSSFKVESLNRLAIATNTTAARTGCGKALKRCEKKSTTTRMNTAARAVESGVRAPPSSLTSDCDVPPLTGKPPPSPATKFDAASARFSWLASNRPPCLATNIRPIAAVSTAPRRKQARASGSNSFKSFQWTAGTLSGGIPCGTAPMSFTPRVSNESADAATMPPITTMSATGLCLRKIFPRSNTASALTPTRRDIELVSLRCLKKWPVFPQKLP